MPMKMSAREYLIATAKELMNTKDIDQISVREILWDLTVHFCRVNAFYFANA